MGPKKYGRVKGILFKFTVPHFGRAFRQTKEEEAICHCLYYYALYLVHKRKSRQQSLLCSSEGKEYRQSFANSFHQTGGRDSLFGLTGFGWPKALSAGEKKPRPILIMSIKIRLGKWIFLLVKASDALSMLNLAKKVLACYFSLI